MNQEKLARMAASVRTGGRGTVRRKHKNVHRSAGSDNVRLEGTLKKLAVNPIGQIEEVNMFRDDGFVIHFGNPRVRANVGSNTYVVSGVAEEKKMQDLLPGILNQLGPDSLNSLRAILENLKPQEGAPENFELKDAENFEAVADQ